MLVLDSWGMTAENKFIADMQCYLLCNTWLFLSIRDKNQVQRQQF